MQPTSTPSTPAATADARLKEKEEWLRKMRGWLMVVAVLVASVTYQAGLNPPGGFWQEDMATPPNGGTASYIRGEGHFAGDPILRDKNYPRFAAFLACNTVAYVQSLCIIVLLMMESSFRGRLRLYVLRVFVVLDVTALGAAYSVGCTRDAYDIYFSVLVLLLLIAFFTAASVAVHLHYKRKKMRSLRSQRSTSTPSVGIVVEEEEEEDGMFGE